MKSITNTAICMMISLLMTASASAYELTSFGLDGGWKSPPSIVLDSSDYTADVDASSVELALLSAFDTWADADSNDKLSFDLLVDGGDDYDVFDGLGASLDQDADWTYADITIGGWLDADYFESLSPGGGDSILAVSVTSKLRGGGSRKPRWTSDIFFNDQFTWSTSPTGGGYDIETVALHEIGHSIGFEHSEGGDSIMAPVYFGIQRELLSDDLAGLAALYGGSGGGGGGRGNNGNGGGRGPNRIQTISDVFIGGVTMIDDYPADFTIQAVPEPSSLHFGFLAVVLLVTVRRK